MCPYTVGGASLAAFCLINLLQEDRWKHNSLTQRCTPTVGTQKNTVYAHTLVHTLPNSYLADIQTPTQTHASITSFPPPSDKKGKKNTAVQTQQIHLQNTPKSDWLPGWLMLLWSWWEIVIIWKEKKSFHTLAKWFKDCLWDSTNPYNECGNSDITAQISPLWPWILWINLYRGRECGSWGQSL